MFPSTPIYFLSEECFVSNVVLTGSRARDAAEDEDNERHRRPAGGDLQCDNQRLADGESKLTQQQPWAWTYQHSFLQGHDRR